MLVFDLATSIPVLEFVSVSVCHTREPDALSFLESIATGFPVLDESKVEPFAVPLPGLEMSSNSALLETD